MMEYLWLIGFPMIVLGGFMHTQNTSSAFASPLVGFGGVILLIKIFAP